MNHRCGLLSVIELAAVIGVVLGMSYLAGFDDLRNQRQSGKAAPPVQVDDLQIGGLAAAPNNQCSEELYWVGVAERELKLRAMWCAEQVFGGKDALVARKVRQLAERCMLWWPDFFLGCLRMEVVRLKNKTEGGHEEHLLLEDFLSQPSMREALGAGRCYTQWPAPG